MSDDDWDDPPESYSPEAVILSVNEEVRKELTELLAFARERQSFGIQTEVECRADPENGTKANRTGEAYGSGYEEASRHFIAEIDRRLAIIPPKPTPPKDASPEGELR